MLTIEIMGDDLLDLGKTIMHLSDYSLHELGWTQDGRNKVFEALNAFGMAKFERGEAVGTINEPEPVTLSHADWKRLFVVALTLRKQGMAGQWPGRVIGRIAAEGLGTI